MVLWPRPDGRATSRTLQFLESSYGRSQSVSAAAHARSALNDQSRQTSDWFRGDSVANAHRGCGHYCHCMFHHNIVAGNQDFSLGRSPAVWICAHAPFRSALGHGGVGSANSYSQYTRRQARRPRRHLAFYSHRSCRRDRGWFWTDISLRRSSRSQTVRYRRDDRRLLTLYFTTIAGINRNAVMGLESRGITNHE
jgi:hypothetical protein